MDTELRADKVLNKVDLVVEPAVRATTHVAAVASLSYFGLISMAGMMPRVAQSPVAATFAEFVTRSVGPTTNQVFSTLFLTKVTPANFVFLIWPAIAVLQLAALSVSILAPIINRKKAAASSSSLKADDLAALTLANVFSTWWLVVASNAAAGSLPLAAFLVLPLVPLLAGFPLRSATPPAKGLYKLMFEVFSSFTTIAAFLALAVELQYGGRLPMLSADLAAGVFLFLTAYVVNLPKRSMPKRVVNLLALTGIITKQVMLAPSLKAVGLLTCSVSFLGTVLVWGMAFQKVLQPGAYGRALRGE